MDKTVFVLCLVFGSSFPRCLGNEYGSEVVPGGCKEGYGTKTQGGSGGEYGSSTSGVKLKAKSPNYGGGSSSVPTSTAPGFDIRQNIASDGQGYGSSGSVGNSHSKGYYGGTPAGSRPSRYGESSKPPHQGYQKDPGIVSGSNTHDYSSKGTYDMPGYGNTNAGVGVLPGYGIETSIIPPTHEFIPGNIPSTPHDYSMKGARGMTGYGYDTNGYSPNPGFGIDRGTVPPANEFIPGNFPTRPPVFPNGPYANNNHPGNSRPRDYIPITGIKVFTDGNNGVVFPAPGTLTTSLPGVNINAVGSYPGNSVKGYPSSNSQGGYSHGGYDDNRGSGRLPQDNGISSYSDINFIEGNLIGNSVNVGGVPGNTGINSYSESSNSDLILTGANSNNYPGNNVRDILPTPPSIGGYPDGNILAGNRPNPVGIFPADIPNVISDPNVAGGYDNPVSNVDVNPNELPISDLITVYLPPRIPEVNTGYLVPMGK